MSTRFTAKILSYAKYSKLESLNRRFHYFLCNLLVSKMTIVKTNTVFYRTLRSLRLLRLVTLLVPQLDPQSIHLVKTRLLTK